MNKKGFDANQMFIYIVAIVVVGGVLIFGGRAVLLFLQSSENIQTTQYLRNLESAATGVANEHGTVRFHDVRLVARADKICIIDKTNSTMQDGNCDQDYGAELCYLWELIVEKRQEPANVFLLQGSAIVQSYHIDNLYPESENNIVCAQSSGQRFEMTNRRGAAYINVTLPSSS
ncbi:MAG: hypothetical protein ACMXYF_00630 [Candidatus Woesearchaeota archaeon]